MIDLQHQIRCLMGMLKRCLWVLVSVFFLGMAGLCLIGIFTPEPTGVTKANYKRVQMGTKEQEVAAVFGFPGADFNWGGKYSKMWYNQKHDYGVIVVFDANDKVSEAILFPQTNVPNERSMSWDLPEFIAVMAAAGTILVLLSLRMKVGGCGPNSACQHRQQEITGGSQAAGAEKQREPHQPA